MRCLYKCIITFLSYHIPGITPQQNMFQAYFILLVYSWVTSMPNPKFWFSFNFILSKPILWNVCLVCLWELPSHSLVDEPDQRQRHGVFFLLSMHFSWSVNQTASHLPTVSLQPDHNWNANYFLIAIKPHHENLTHIHTPNEFESFSIGLRASEDRTDIITSLWG